MKRSSAFEAAMIIVLVGLLSLLYYAIVSTPNATRGWEVQGADGVDYMFVGSNDTLYAFHGDNITAIKSDGNVAWDYQVPDGWEMVTSGVSGHPIVSENAGAVYLFLYSPMPESLPCNYSATTEIYYTDNFSRIVRPSYPNSSFPSKIVKISPQGKIAWEYPINVSILVPATSSNTETTTMVRAVNGRVYVFHDYMEEVLSEDGQFLFRIDNASGPAAIDEAGNMYLVRAERPNFTVSDSWNKSIYLQVTALENDPRFLGEDVYRIAYDPHYLIKTGTIEAYSPAGALLWSTDIGEKIEGDYDVAGQYFTPPLYLKGMLYVPVGKGIAALAANGTICWIKHFAEYSYVGPFTQMPIDDSGNVNLVASNDYYANSRVFSISPDGNVSENQWNYNSQSPFLVIRADGMAYDLTDYAHNSSQGPAYSKLAGSFKADVLTVFSVKTGKVLWTFPVPEEDMHYLVLNWDNIGQAMPDPTMISDAKHWNQVPDVYEGIPADKFPMSHSINYQIGINPSRNVTYLNYYMAVYDNPIIFNYSRCIYVNTLYALDNNGRLLWKKPVSGLITTTAVGNGTIYYSTNNGMIGGNTAGIAGGVTLLAVAYLFIRFFMIGAVARAKNRMEQNANRKIVLRHIADNPGVTVADIASGLPMNIGTVRYHLFILGLNHKVIAYKADNKYRRYFTNAGTFTSEDQALISVIRREPLRKTLQAVAERPGLSGPELAMILNVSAAAAHQDLSLLARKGIIEQVPNSDRCYGYHVKGEYRQRIAHVIERIG